jgi:hypothetical protein
VDPATTQRIAHLPPVSILFAAFLGFDPIAHLVGSSTLAHLPPSAVAQLTAHSYFPSLISEPFRAGLHEAFVFAAVACLIAAAASWSRGGRYIHGVDLSSSAVSTARPANLAADMPIPAMPPEATARHIQAE